MSVSASEIEKAKSRDRNRLPRQYTQEYRLEAVGYYRKARKADPKKSIRECVAELGINDKTLNDWILKYSKTGKVTQERTDEQKELDAARRHIHELESENEFLKKPQPSLPGASDVGLTCIVFSDSAEAAASIDIHVPAQELATLASEKSMGESEIAAAGTLFSYLAERKRRKTVDTLLRLSRLPSKEPKTFEGFAFTRIQGRDADMLYRLPAHRNIAFISPEGIGKTHLAQAYGRECCMKG